MKLYYYSGQENKEFWDLLEQLRTKAKCISSEWKGDFYVSTYELNGQKYIYEEDFDLGIPHSIIEVNRYKRSQINAWKEEYTDTLENGIILSRYDVMKNDGLIDEYTEIEEDEEENNE